MLVPTADSILHQVRELRDHQELTDHSMLLAMPWQGLLAQEICIEGSKPLCWRQCRLKLEPCIGLGCRGSVLLQCMYTYCCCCSGGAQAFQVSPLHILNVHSGVTAVSPGTAQVDTTDHSHKKPVIPVQ